MEGVSEREERSHNLFPKMAQERIASFAVLKALIKDIERPLPALCKNPLLPPCTLSSPHNHKVVPNPAVPKIHRGSGGLLDLRNGRKK